MKDFLEWWVEFRKANCQDLATTIRFWEDAFAVKFVFRKDVEINGVTRTMLTDFCVGVEDFSYENWEDRIGHSLLETIRVFRRCVEREKKEQGN